MYVCICVPIDGLAFRLDQLLVSATTRGLCQITTADWEEAENTISHTLFPIRLVFLLALVTGLGTESINQGDEDK